MKTKWIAALLILFAFAGMVNAQDRTISGMVTFDVDGKGLSGVLVTVKEIKVSVRTDLFGKYLIPHYKFSFCSGNCEIRL